MGESQTQVELEQEAVIRPTFNGAIRVEARPERLSADAGALMMREVMERTGLIDWIDGRFNDPRQSDQITHSVSELMRTRCCFWLRVGAAPTMRTTCARIRRFG